MSDLVKNHRYSLKWARDVVDTFYRGHARASEYVGLIWGVHRAQVAVWVANGDVMWTVFKRIAKIYETWMAKGWKEDYRYTNVKYEHKTWLKMYPAESERVLEHLKSLDESGKFKELAFRTGLEVSEVPTGRRNPPSPTWVQGELWPEVKSTQSPGADLALQTGA